MKSLAAWSALPLSLALIGLSACGSSGEEQKQDSNQSAATESKAEVAAIDPCSLVTAEEVALVIGEKVLAAKAEDNGCIYETEDADASTVNVEVKQGGAAEEMETVRGGAKLLGNIGGGMKDKEGAVGDVGNVLAAKQEGAGVGDDSLFDASGRLHIRKGDFYVVVGPPIMRSRMSGGNPLLSGAERRKMATEIAQKAVRKI
jgi:hypothetical protein